LSDRCVIPLLHDYDVKEVKLHTLKLKHDNNTKKETFNVKKSDGTTIKILFNTVVLFQTMSSRMEFTSPMIFLYIDKCLLNNALEEWCSVMPHQEDQTIKNFKFSLEEWFTALLSDNAFLV
jgi:hypothetical protein